ncbi:MAG TPA: 3'(2'),5'-bisphosphate nucleotidase CysQ [Cyclobacteriaceae bacterium]|nr:3'(2'),5'-bisphosphate nucleotidase CysQ [Cyclobacteriaceae bacterium]HMV08985.1 3'(2'),5'-bisphosphate nucleotidase CysQ [Cyclobacteriaceae bacterium]HMX00260.1 3'(2'),5'-bisphosphate nucleotidase CysQ [Cyclobacteriaceae bacterium]HMX49741.1 3'(2'),5'-bisphosphate nucleotidase CysQ [Cyclobacteriaceae bacterium]HMY93080.1 3'(2'),5'-bisphosphate nucleotidase CysQ [Cyclobacteriaceae bacterium]
MDQNQLQELLKIAIRAAEVASIKILEVYNSSDFQVNLKDDKSPLTLADRESHRAIEALLKGTGLPILSEEGKSIPYETRKQWKHFWLIDPLDGTKEFIKRNGEFTVNIALIENQTPILGVVAVPVTGDVYYASRGAGAYLKRPDFISPISKRTPADLSRKGLRIVASRSHMNEETEMFIQRLDSPELISAGSSLKFMLLALGNADVYPRFAPTMEWDTAAAHAVINEVGLRVFRQGSEEELLYNKPDLLNPYFICY